MCFKIPGTSHVQQSHSSEAYVEEGGNLGSVPLPQTKETESFHVILQEDFPPACLETTKQQKVLIIGFNPP